MIETVAVGVLMSKPVAAALKDGRCGVFAAVRLPSSTLVDGRIVTFDNELALQLLSLERGDAIAIAGAVVDEAHELADGSLEEVIFEGECLMPGFATEDVCRLADAVKAQGESPEV
jgi:hypothetical protein